MNNPYLVLFYFFHSLVTRSLFFLLENHRFRSAAALLPNLHSVVMMFVLVSLCCLSWFLRLPCAASRAKKKCVPNYERRLFDFVFRETNGLGAKARRRKGNLPYPTLPYPYPYFHFSLSTRFLLLLLLLLFLFVFLSVSKAKNVVFVCFIFVRNTFYAFSFGYLFAACIRGLPEQTFVSVLVDHTFRQNDGSC